MPARKTPGATLTAGVEAKPLGTENADRLSSALPVPSPSSEQRRSRGRPVSGGAGMPVTLRLPPDLYAGLAAHLPGLAEHGRTLPTVQDLLRSVAAAIVDEPETIRKLWQKGRRR
jgi:hypothetical protein